MSGPGPEALALLARPTWGDVWRGALAQWLIFVPLLIVLMALASITLSPGYNGSIYAIFSPLLSAPVGAIVTFGLGAPLAMLLARRLVGTTAWVAHLVAFMGLGFILAAALIHLWMLVTGHFFDSPLWWGSTYIYLPIVSAAALSVGAGWSIAWHRAVVRERTPEVQLALVAQ